MTHTVIYLVHYSSILLLVWIFAEQMGAPIPSAPILLLAGARAARGQMNLLLFTSFATAATLSANLFWYSFGRSRGTKVLGQLCRLCLEPDSCVRRAEKFFSQHGLRALLLAKFVPGLNTVAAPVAGTIRAPWWKFLILDALGTLMWVMAFESLGFAFSGPLEALLAYALREGAFLLGLAVLAALAVYVIGKHRRRLRFLEDLRVARITPAELKRRLDSHESVAIVDLRHSLDFLAEPYTIPGAMRIPLEELERRHSEIPKDREIVLYCTCPNEASSALTAVKLRNYGITRVHPLEGGFHTWREMGFPVAEMRTVPGVKTQGVPEEALVSASLPANSAT
jgi:membrane protein DedA with SNARE-associated domain/rhodanese-related sulfurtransferase